MMPEAEVARHVSAYKGAKQVSSALLPWVISAATLVFTWVNLTVTHGNAKVLNMAAARQERYIANLEEIRRDLDTLRQEVERLSERYAPRPTAPPED